jgi:alcohol dehydrogenase YqhD (iron-dependent ADH family)
MYSWESTYLEEYAQGHIIVEANSVEEARQKALESFDEYDRDFFEWEYEEDQDEYDKQSILKRHKEFKEDISVEPEISEVIFIRGSQ